MHFCFIDSPSYACCNLKRIVLPLPGIQEARYVKKTGYWRH